jgi:hypothetical protein
MNKITIQLLVTLTVTVMATSCVKDLDRFPAYQPTTETVYADFANYKLILAKIYAGLVTSGQAGPAGQPDIAGIDEGFSNYLRQYWKVQELPTDEAVIAWNDGTLPEYHKMTWTSSNEFNRAMYDRIYYQISIANEFIRQTTDAKLSDRNITGADAEQSRQFRAEARFLRALSYWHALDLYGGNVPFVTDADPIGAFLPLQTNSADLYAYVESELLDIESLLVDARTGEYGRADKAAAWMLLAKLYLNAERYIGQAKYTECLTQVNKVLAAGYGLAANYADNFLADNNTSPEIIFSANCDGIKTQSYGAMTFLIHAAVGGSMQPAGFGINGGWFGLRTTSAFVNKFADPTGATDKRAMFFTNGQNLEINDLFNFTDGYAITKFKNVTQAGVSGSDPSGTFVDTDWPMFRLTDAHLMYIECVLRNGNGGSRATALAYANAIRERAYGDETGAINDSELTLDWLLDERARELYWEATRRTDLIRFNKFTSGDYLWPWKGGVKEGVAVGDFRNMMPIPASDITANTNLQQNEGY